MGARISEAVERRSFWTKYQPGMRASAAEPGTPEFFAEVERRRYALEPGTAEMAAFERWAGRDVLEAGCGIARAGARYTGMDFSPTALDLARRRFVLEGRAGEFVRGSITELPFAAESFDLTYSMGVLHHLPETRRVVDEMHRVLRPGGQAVVMVYHRDSFNYVVSIMLLRRALASLLLLPGAERAVAAMTGEDRAVLRGHRELLREHGLGYLADPALFLSHNTDGPGNPLSKVYSRRAGAALFERFDRVETHVRFLNLRAYPLGERLEATPAAQWLGRRWGWHLWIRATKGG
jgi:SAM-dependent methyltransferase